MAPCGACVILVNVVLAYFVFAERLYWTDAVGSLCILGGCCSAIITGSREVSVTTIAAYTDQWLNSVFWLFFGLQIASLVAVTVLLGWARKYEAPAPAEDGAEAAVAVVAPVDHGHAPVAGEREHLDARVDVDVDVDEPPGVSARGRIELGAVAVSDECRVASVDAIGDADGAAAAVVVALQPQQPLDAPMSPRVAHVLSAFCLAWWAATVSTWLNLFGKSIAQLFTLAIVNQQNAFVTAWPYVCIVGVLITAVGSVRILQLMTRKHDALLCIPLYQCGFMIQLIALGWCFFGEFAALSSLDIGLFCLSIAVCVAGVVLVAQRPLPLALPPPAVALDADDEAAAAAAEQHDAEPHLDAPPVDEAPPSPPASPALPPRASPSASHVVAAALELVPLHATALATAPLAVRLRTHCVRADTDAVARICARLGSQRAIELPSPWSTATERRIRAVLA